MNTSTKQTAKSTHWLGAVLLTAGDEFRDLEFNWSLHGYGGFLGSAGEFLVLEFAAALPTASSTPFEPSYKPTSMSLINFRRLSEGVRAGLPVVEECVSAGT